SHAHRVVCLVDLAPLGLGPAGAGDTSLERYDRLGRLFRLCRADHPQRACYIGFVGTALRGKISCQKIIAVRKPEPPLTEGEDVDWSLGVRLDGQREHVAAQT